MTDWVNSLVIVKKQNGSLRLCLDPRDLNKAIKREHFKLPTAEEIFAEMNNPKYFTKLDASNGYWHIPVDEESSKLLTFNSPFGRFSFTWLPYEQCVRSFPGSSSENYRRDKRNKKLTRRHNSMVGNLRRTHKNTWKGILSTTQSRFEIKQIKIGICNKATDIFRSLNYWSRDKNQTLQK